MASARFSAFDRSYYTTDGYDTYLERFATTARENIAPAILRAIGSLPKATFLDVGCGMGGIVLALRERGYEAHGTEVSPYCLEHSPARAWMRLGDACALPFPDRSFDVVTCIDMFQYLTREQMERAAREIVRVARRFIVFETIDADSPNANQGENPDVLRLPACTEMRGDDYAALFTRNGCTLLRTGILSSEFDFSALFALGHHVSTPA